ncbi:MAG: 7-carboxy-7-deazaguanine synthase QueE [Bacteroidales bacterium]|nr:7-carboxy-7-deazaguanine synthase QueE [Bacteroidales bacterium]
MLKVNEIFYSLQGEGCNSGRPAVFVRLSGCNLNCPFCDTMHTTGQPMTEADIVAAVAAYETSWVVITGGEPALQLNAELVDGLHRAGKTVAVETNGTLPLPPQVDWVTLSPKDLFLGPQAAPVLSSVSELKVVYDGRAEVPEYEHIDVQHGRYLQPCDTGRPDDNADLVAKTVAYCLAHPQWNLSLQIHKMLNIK